VVRPAAYRLRYMVGVARAGALDLPARISGDKEHSKM
jgi:hypothetical protein